MINPINITQEMLPEKVIEIAHTAQAVPSLIYSWIFFAISLFIIGHISLDTPAGKRKFNWTWLTVILLSGAFVVWLSLSPITVNKLTQWFLSWIS